MSKCGVCGKNIGLLSSYKIYDGSICEECTKLSQSYNTETIENMRKYKAIEDSRKRLFKPGKRLKNFGTVEILIDNTNKLFKIGNSPIYKFEELADFYLDQTPANTVVTTTTKKKGGITRAIVGSMIAGPVGAVVGASTAGSVSTSTQSTNTTKCYYYEIECYSGNVKKAIMPPDGFKEFAIQCINERNKTNNKFNDNNTKELPEVDAISEIKKFKELLDMGAISQEEFNQKKKELLNL